MTKSELLASMAGSMACIAGGVMAVYISMGVPAPYLIAASLMAAPAALVISKIVYPETEESQTKGTVSLEIKKTHANLLDAISHGAGDGLKVSLNVLAMLIGFIALIAMVDAGLDGIEISHRDQTEEQRELLREVVAQYGIIATGSSDYHGNGKLNELAEFTTNPDDFEALEARADARRVVRK